MQKRLGIVMDDIASIKPAKDTSFALLLEAQRRGYAIDYMQTHDLLLKGDVAYGLARQLRIVDGVQDYVQAEPARLLPLHELDLILMRKDPPIDQAFLQALYILEVAERQGAVVLNQPQALRDIHEKLSSLWFQTYAPPSIVTADYNSLHAFVSEHKHVILKPLNHMGGHGVLQAKKHDANLRSMWELLTHNGQLALMAQRFIPEIVHGDKRVLLVHGQVISHALVRVPQMGEIRANLAVGGKGHAAPLTQRDREIAESVSKALQGRGLALVGLDIIGDYLTEVNVTSPTGVRELERDENLPICQTFFDCI